MGRIAIGKVDELKPGSMKKVTMEGRDEIVVANVEGKFYAMRGLCNHQGGPLAEGELEGGVVTCPWHGSKWDITTGKLVEFPIELESEPTYNVIEEGGNLYIDV